LRVRRIRGGRNEVDSHHRRPRTQHSRRKRIDGAGRKGENQQQVILEASKKKTKKVIVRGP
jgi:hypothetical protein